MNFRHDVLGLNERLGMTQIERAKQSIGTGSGLIETAVLRNSKQSPSSLGDFIKESTVRLAPDRLRRVCHRRQAGRRDELMSNKARHRFPEQIAISAQAQQRTLDAIETSDNCFAGVAGTSPVEPGLKRFDQNFRSCASGIAGDDFQPSRKLFRQEKLVAFLEGLHRPIRDREWRMFAPPLLDVNGAV